MYEGQRWYWWVVWALAYTVPYILVDLAFDRWVPERFQTPIGVALFTLFMVALVAVPALMYVRGRRRQVAQAQRVTAT